ncbi:MAG: response regulator [candidate division Zixibacteria bacterium]|nr:response regulator [candidate division Zixibacteria bacterium]
MPGRIKLLIADDEIKFLESIAKRLEMRDFEVTKATNGQEALTIAGSQKFDLALLDLKMPGVNGRQVLEVLKREHRFLEVIILTGHGSLDSAVECTKLGAFDYLPKPYELEKLLEVLRRAYEARLQKKFEADQERLEKIADMATGSSALSILRELRKLDDDEK